jgi:Mrp family chromosome partitioning ATPase
MTRIFEAIKKARVSRPQTGQTTPIQPVRPHPSGAATSAAVSMPDPLRFGLVPRPFDGTLDVPEDVMREMTGLRMTLESALPARVPRTVMLMSAQRGEGTSTVAAQFAVAVARDAAQRVRLMDMTARRPSPFIESVAAPASPRQTGVQRARDPNAEASSALDVLRVPDGARATGLISAPVAREWVESFSGRYDWIVLDGPAVLEAPDAPALAAMADGVVIVIEAGRTKRPVLHRSTDLLRNARAQLIGSVLNRRRLEVPEFLYRRI